MANNSSVRIDISVGDQYSKGFNAAAQKARELDKALASFGTQSNDTLQRKIDGWRAGYDALAKSGKLTEAELSRAHASMQLMIEKTAQKMQGIKLPDVKDMELSRFGVRSERAIKAEIKELEDGYKRLADAGILSSEELARAQEAALAKVKQLRSEMQAPIKMTPVESALSKIGIEKETDILKRIKEQRQAFEELAKSEKVSGNDLVRARAQMIANLNAESEKLKALKVPSLTDMAMGSLGLRSKTDIKSEIQETINAYRSLEKSGVASASELARAQEAALAKVKQLRSEMQAPIKITPVQVDMNKLGMRSHAEIAAEIKELEASYKRLAKSGLLSSSELAQAKLKLINQTSELRKETNGWVDSLMQAKESIAGLAASLAVVGASVNKAINFETDLSDVSKVADFADTKALQDFGDELKNLSREIPLTVNELAAMAAAAGQMGIAKDQLTGFVEVAAKMSTAFKMTGDESGQSIGTLMTVFNLSLPQVERLGDAINYLGNTTNAKEKQIIEVLTRIGGIGQQFGLSARELSALAASFLSLGKSPEVAGTAINALLSKLSTANVQSKDFKEALGALGISANQLADDISTNPTQALDAFLTKLSSLPKQTQGDTIGRLFGAEFADDVAVLVQSLETYRKNLAGVADENSTAGAMQEEFSKRLETTRAQLDLMTNALNEIAINFGTAFLPVIESIAQASAAVSQLVADITNSKSAVYALSAGLLVLAARMEIVQKIGAALGLLFANLGGAKAIQSMGGIAGVIGGIAAEGEKASKSVGKLQKALSMLTFSNALNGVALFTGAIYAGGAAVEFAFDPAIKKIEQTEKKLKDLTKAQQDWANLQAQAQNAGMSDAQLEQIRQVKIETLNTQAVLQQGAQFNAQLNEQAMAQVRAQIGERVRLQDLLAAKVVEKTNAEAALEKAKQAEIKQARIDSYNLAKQKLDQFINDKRTALQNEQQAEQSAINNIKQLRQQLADQLQSDADRMREIQRRDLDEGAQQADIAAQAAEKLAAAQQAAYNGDGKGASKLANDAKTLAERLKDSTKAMELFKQASDLDAQANELQQYQEQLKAQAAQKQQVKISADISAAESQLELLNANIAAMTDDPKQVQIEAVDEATAAINAIQAQLDALKDKTVTVTVVEKTVQARRWGGFITDPLGNIPRFRTGGKLPGYGGGDRIHALLEAGEFIVRKEAVAKYGAGAMHAINTMRLPKFQNGGMVGGDARTGSEALDLVNINLNLGGGRIVPFTTKREQVQSIKDAFAFIERGGIV